MNVTIDINALPIDQQKGLYLELRRKFELHGLESGVPLDRFLDFELWNYRQELGVRTIKLLEEAGIRSVRGICICTRADILAIKGIGKEMLSDIERFLKAIAMSLRSEG
jgi:Bacterial RNA polymerase, alpha chain C terminal domain